MLILNIASRKRLQTDLTGANGKCLRSCPCPDFEIVQTTAMALCRSSTSKVEGGEPSEHYAATVDKGPSGEKPQGQASAERRTVPRAERWHGVTRNRIKATRPTIPLSHIHPHRSNTDMGIRDSFSRSKKKVKHLLTGRKHKSGGTGTETGEESVGSVGSLPQSVPDIVAGSSRNLADNRASGGGRAGSADQFPQQDEPELAPAGGSETGQGGGEVDVDRGEVGQRHSHLDPDVEAVVGSGSGREGSNTDEVKVKQVHPSPSTPSIPHGREPDGMLMWLLQLPPHLIPPSECVDTSIVPDRDVQEVLRPDENPKPRAADDSENKPDWRSMVSSTIKLLHGVRDGPLKSVAGGLCTILENCEV